MDAKDHDLLIEVRTEVRNLRVDVGELKDGLTNRVKDVENEKMAKEAFAEYKEESDKLHEDHEARIRILERWVWLAIGGLAILQIVLRFLPIKVL